MKRLVTCMGSWGSSESLWRSHAQLGQPIAYFTSLSKALARPLAPDVRLGGKSESDRDMPVRPELAQLM